MFQDNFTISCQFYHFSQFSIFIIIIFQVFLAAAGRRLQHLICAPE